MRLPPSYSQFPHYPVSAGTSLLAIGVTLAHMAGSNISPLMENVLIRRGEYWRLLTCILPHDGWMHLLFNIYWMWVLGTCVEEFFGHFRTALLVIILAVGSSAYEFAFLEGGIGLSGVVYGLFGLIWVLGRYDQRFSDVIDARTAQIFVAWFFLCILLTATHMMLVANFAHGTGALLGVLVGFNTVESPYRKLSFLLLMLVFSGGVWGATAGRPRVNFSQMRGYPESQWAYDALVSGHNDEAAKWFRDAVAYRPKNAAYWYDLGISYERLHRPDEAIAAFRKVSELGDTQGETAIGAMYQSGAAGIAKNDALAVAWYKRAAEEGDGDAQNALSWIYSTSKDPAVRNPVAALEYAKKSVEALKGDIEPQRFDTLAHAYFVNGQVEEAIKTQTQAVAAAEEADKTEFSGRLDEYKAARQRQRPAPKRGN